MGTSYIVDFYLPTSVDEARLAYICSEASRLSLHVVTLGCPTTGAKGSRLVRFRIYALGLTELAGIFGLVMQHLQPEQYGFPPGITERVVITREEATTAPAG